MLAKSRCAETLPVATLARVRVMDVGVRVDGDFTSNAPQDRARRLSCRYSERWSLAHPALVTRVASCQVVSTRLIRD
jgi:hypothetical protein